MHEYHHPVWMDLLLFQVIVRLSIFEFLPCSLISPDQSAIILKRSWSLLTRRVRPGHGHEGKALERTFVNVTVLQEALISKRLRKGLTVTETGSQDYQQFLVLLLRVRYFVVTGAFRHIWLILIWKILNISFLHLFWSQVCWFPGWSWCLQKVQVKHFLHKRCQYNLTSASVCRRDW